MDELNRQGGDPTRVVGRRIFGGILEGILDLMLITGLAQLFGLDAFSSAVTPLPLDAEQRAAQLVALYLIGFLYFLGTKVVPLGLWGWTPGMLCVGVRCVRWDGRPPGLLRAFGRSFFFNVYTQFWCLLPATAIFPMYLSTGHRGIQDMLVGTYVVDNQWFGHMVMVTNEGVSAGPMSVRREEAQKLLASEGIDVSALGPRLPANAKSGNPFLDKELDTYVVWNKNQERFLAFDKASGSWEPLD